MLRLSTRPAALPFLNRFEVAVPVVELGQGTCRADWMRQAAFIRPLGRDAATPASPADPLMPLPRRKDGGCARASSTSRLGPRLRCGSVLL